MHPTLPVLPADADVRYNKRWSIRLLLLNAVLLSWLTMGDSLHGLFGPYAFWMIPTLPAVLAALGGMVAASLPKAMRRPFYILIIICTMLTVLGGMMAFWAANFLHGKW